MPSNSQNAELTWKQDCWFLTAIKVISKPWGKNKIIHKMSIFLSVPQTWTKHNRQLPSTRNIRQQVYFFFPQGWKRDCRWFPTTKEIKHQAYHWLQLVWTQSIWWQMKTVPISWAKPGSAAHHTPSADSTWLVKKHLTRDEMTSRNQ